MPAEVLNITVVCRADKASLEQTIRDLRNRKLTFFEVPRSLGRTSAEAWPTGSSDTDRPQIRVEYMK